MTALEVLRETAVFYCSNSSEVKCLREKSGFLYTELCLFFRGVC